MSPAELPFIAGEVPKYRAPSPVFNGRLPAFVSETLNTDYVRVPANLESIGDNTHWNSAAQRIVGVLYAQKMLKMAYNVDITLDVDMDAPPPETDPGAGGNYQKITLNGANITASHSQTGNTPNKVADGDWQSDDGKRWMGILYPPDPAWLTIDLGEVKFVEYVDIYFRRQNHATDSTWKPHTYKLQYTETAEGDDFTDLFEETRQSLTTLPYNREEVRKNVRRLKILITDSAKPVPDSVNKYVSIHEVELFEGAAE
jgi:hypothetical protein